MTKRIRKSKDRPLNNNSRKNLRSNLNHFEVCCPDCGHKFTSYAGSLARALEYHKTNAKNCIPQSKLSSSSSSSSYMGVVDVENTVSIFSEIPNVVQPDLEVNDEAEFGEVDVDEDNMYNSEYEIDDQEAHNNEYGDDENEGETEENMTGDMGGTELVPLSIVQRKKMRYVALTRDEKFQIIEEFFDVKNSLPNFKLLEMQRCI